MRRVWCRDVSIPWTFHPCRVWTGMVDRDGYATIKIGGRNGKKRAAHRVSYEYFKGPVPKGCDVDHLCHTTNCIEPSHLSAVPARVNRSRQRPDPKLKRAV